MIDKNQLPDIIAGYVNAQNSFDSDALANNFSADAVVYDEGNTYDGTEEIRQWNIKGNAKYHTQMRPLEVIGETNHYAVKIEMSGTFPGSPVTATFSFDLKDGKIAALKIA